jgi:hypothetical protein
VISGREFGQLLERFRQTGLRSCGSIEVAGLASEGNGDVWDGLASILAELRRIILQQHLRRAEVLLEGHFTAIWVKKPIEMGNTPHCLALILPTLVGFFTTH